MTKPAVFLPLALLALTTMPAAAQEAPPRVLFCMGQCFGVDDNGNRVPVTKGTELAPGQHLETGPDSYAQVKLGKDSACGIGERARVRFDRRGRDRDVVILDQGRIRVLGGDLIGRPIARPVELHTADGNFVLRSADIEVKSLPKTGPAPAPTLVKLNLGDVRIGGLPVTPDVVHGIVGGKVLDTAIPIGDIALPTPSRELALASPGAPAGKEATLSAIALPVVDLPLVAPKQFTTPEVVSSAIVSPEFTKTTLANPALSITGAPRTDQPVVYAPPAKAVVPASALILASPISTLSTGTTSLNTVAKVNQVAPTTTPKVVPIQTIVFQPPPPPTTTTVITTTLPRLILK
jgi:hypothetical protein